MHLLRKSDGVCVVWGLKVRGGDLISMNFNVRERRGPASSTFIKSDCSCKA